MTFVHNEYVTMKKIDMLVVTFHVYVICKFIK